MNVGRSKKTVDISFRETAFQENWTKYDIIGTDLVTDSSVIMNPSVILSSVPLVAKYIKMILIDYSYIKQKICSAMSNSVRLYQLDHLL